MKSYQWWICSSIGNSQCYRCRDGSWITHSNEAETFWKRLKTKIDEILKLNEKIKYTFSGCLFLHTFVLLYNFLMVSLCILLLQLRYITSTQEFKTKKKDHASYRTFPPHFPNFFNFFFLQLTSPALVDLSLLLLFGPFVSNYGQLMNYVFKNSTLWIWWINILLTIWRLCQ